MTTEFGDFLEIEPLTLCPIDKKPIVAEMLTPEEIQWLDEYHKTVYEKLSPYLDDDDLVWLEEACSKLQKSL